MVESNNAPLARIVSICADCREVIDTRIDRAPSDGSLYQPPQVGHPIELHEITDVKQLPHSATDSLDGYEVTLDTRGHDPHCELAKQRT